jgi:hypothetical protein
MSEGAQSFACIRVWKIHGTKQMMSKWYRKEDKLRQWSLHTWLKETANLRRKQETLLWKILPVSIAIREMITPQQKSTAWKQVSLSLVKDSLTVLNNKRLMESEMFYLPHSNCQNMNNSSKQAWKLWWYFQVVACRQSHTFTRQLECAWWATVWESSNQCERRPCWTLGLFCALRVLQS